MYTRFVFVEFDFEHIQLILTKNGKYQDYKFKFRADSRPFNSSKPQKEADMFSTGTTAGQKKRKNGIDT